MKVSIITVCYNSENFIEDAILSVINQNYADIEYIVVDGGSTDSTLSLIKKYSNRISCLISEPDKGIYDAMNKGLKNATGDLIGFLNSDDVFIDTNVISNVVDHFSDESIGIVYGNVKIVDPHNLAKVKRIYDASRFKLEHFKFGIMPPHPAIYIRRELYHNMGNFDTNFKVAADFDLILRFFSDTNFEELYINFVPVLMRDGGISNQGFYKSKRIITKELMQACKKNNIHTNLFLLNLRFIFKLKQIIFR